MGLYLCVFDEENELDGVDVGSYADFNNFRGYVVKSLEGGNVGSRFPILNGHSDCDGEWSPRECVGLEEELNAIATSFKEIAPVDFTSEWQKRVVKLLGLQPRNLYECFIDVDGELLIDRLQALCRLAHQNNQPILFQ
jgi:hypothetical protein